MPGSPHINLKRMRIVQYPDPVLRRRAKPIAEITDELRAVAERMVQLMNEAEGVGLAAPQVGISWRMFIANSREDDDPPRVYVNPVLRDPVGELESREEGCLSIPQVVGEVWRHPGITIDATDLEGRPFTMSSLDTFLARIWQHECDHLDGKLILDRFGQMAKLSNRRTLRELERAARL